VARNSEIGSSDLSKKNCITCENTELFSILIGENIARALSGVARCGDNSCLNISYLELGLVLHFFEFKLVDLSFGVFSHDNRNLKASMGG
jgi:hypothetical protein